MHPLRLFALVLPLATLAACTVAPRPVVVTTPPPVVQTTPAPTAAAMGGPGAVTVEIPAGHFPPAGSCRIWVPGRAVAQQEPPGSCTDLMNRVPPGAMLLRG